MLKKVIVLAVIFTALSFTVQVMADEPSATPTETPTPTPEINDYYKLPLVRGDSYNINNMIRYYNEVLNADQQKIVRFLLGSYNFMYLTARGFSYEDVTIFDDYVLKFDELANMIFNAESIANSSRWSSTFQVYIASIITYAGTINDTFDNWVNNEASTLLIPYTNEALEAWTTFYNDPTNEGIANFGAESREWTLGNVYDFAYSNSVMTSYAQERINDMVLNYSPIMYTNSVYDAYNRNSSQIIVSFKDVPLIDTIYVLRSQPGQGLQYYRFGFYNGTFTQYQLYTNELLKTDYNNAVNAGSLTRLGTYNFNVNTLSAAGTLSDIIVDAVYRTPVNINFPRTFNNWYIGLTHIVMVDDLNTLANRQDVYNDFSLGLISDYEWIKKPKNDLPYWWKPIDFNIEIEDPSGNLDPASDDDFDQNIVNNTVINNFDIVAPGVQINVPVNWFDSEGNYLDYTYNYGLPFFVFVGDVFNSLGEIRIIILGVLIFGLVSGIIVKFLQ